MLLIVVAGGLSYTRLGREEDPAFTIKSMVVYASWPGATVVEMTNQVTDRIERKLQELDTLDYTKSYTTSGQTDDLRQSQGRHAGTPRARDLGPGAQQGERHQGRPAVERAGRQFQRPVRRRVRQHLCAHRRRPLFRQLRDYAEQARAQILKIPGAGKVELLGTQDEVIYLNFSTQHVAGLGLDQQAVLNSLQQQNAVAPSGVIQAGPEQVTLGSAAISLRSRAWKA
jgi:multidrug efflux pump subunit AcrB